MRIPTLNGPDRSKTKNGVINFGARFDFQDSTIMLDKSYYNNIKHDLSMVIFNVVSKRQFLSVISSAALDKTPIWKETKQ